MARRARSIVTCVVGLFVAAGVALAAAGPEDTAQAAAESWLRLVDGGDYPASWAQAAQSLKRAVRQPEWSEAVSGVRGPLGQLVSRKLKSREYTDKVAPTTRVIGGKVYTWGGRGPHVVIAFDSAFAKKASAVETVITVRDLDGVWRVSEYSVR
jgi:hypothetical protein